MQPVKLTMSAIEDGARSVRPLINVKTIGGVRSFHQRHLCGGMTPEVRQTGLGDKQIEDYVTIEFFWVSFVSLRMLIGEA